MTVLGYFLSIQLVFFQFYVTHCLHITLKLLDTVVWIKEITTAQQVAVKVFMNTLDGLGAPVLKYHAHIFSITTTTNSIRNKQTWKTQKGLNSILTHIRIFLSN